jgi:hypothetical protein
MNELDDSAKPEKAAGGYEEKSWPGKFIVWIGLHKYGFALIYLKQQQ